MKPTVLTVLPIMREFQSKKGNEVGGVYHIVLDDGNIENHHVEWCLEEAEKQNDTLAIKLGELLMKMSRTQRSKLSKLFYQL